MSLPLRWYNARAHAFFTLDLSDLKDLAHLHAFIYELSPDRLFAFLRRMYPNDQRYPYAIDAIKALFAQTPEATEEHRLLGDILRLTFDHARATMHRAWKETIEVFETTDLDRLTDLFATIRNHTEHTKEQRIDAHDLFSLLGLRALSLDALAYLLSREEQYTPPYEIRTKILNAAKLFTKHLDHGTYVDRDRAEDLYHYSDLDGNTIAHHIADGTLFPGAEQIPFSGTYDRKLLALTNFAGQTAEKVYSARLAREAQVETTVSL